ncbi:MAG: hypothetical protein LYZ70_07935 [Nitrososphaerales archaeon]|nr:hypothetical protein [Nitrososphaerales archaeon]
MSEERESLCAELSEIEADLVEQLIKTYRRGANYEEFWEIVRRVSSFSEMRKNFCTRMAVGKQRPRRT